MFIPFEELEHPRAGKGSPTGGQFVAKGGGKESKAQTRTGFLSRLAGFLSRAKFSRKQRQLFSAWIYGRGKGEFKYEKLRQSDEVTGMLQKLPEHQGKMFRATTVSKDKLVEGAKITLNKHSSFTTDGDLAAKAAGDKGTVLEVESSTGRRIPGRQEVVGLKGTEYQVTDVSGDTVKLVEAGATEVQTKENPLIDEFTNSIPKTDFKNKYTGEVRSMYKPGSWLLTTAPGISKDRAQYAKEAVVNLGGSTQEILMLVSDDDTNMAVPISVGNTGSAALSDDMVANINEAYRTGKHWDVHHNHPENLPLSIGDIVTLNAYPGIRAVHAHTIEGDTFTASMAEGRRLGTIHLREMLTDAWFDVDKDALSKANNKIMALSLENENDAQFLLMHAVDQAANDYGLINYSGELTKERQALVNKYSTELKNLRETAIKAFRAMSPEFEKLHPRDEGGKFTEKTFSELNPEVINVGGDEWNKSTAIRLETEYQNSRSELEQIEQATLGDDVDTENSDEDEDTLHENAPYVPEDWDMMTEAMKDDAFDKFKSYSHDEFLDSEISNYYDEQADDDARVKVAEDFNDGSDTEWAEEVIADWREEQKVDVPYTDEQILKAIDLEHDPGNWPHEKGTSISINNDALGPRPGFGPNQFNLPGIEPPKEGLSDDQEVDLVDALEKAFDNQATKLGPNMDPPDYLSDNIEEYQDEYWSTMDDKDKWNWVKQHTSIIEDLEKEQEDYYNDHGAKKDFETLDELPTTYDPMQYHDNSDYRKTQLLAHAMSIRRVKQLMERRGLGFGTSTDAEIRRSDNVLWNGWKGASTSMEGQILQIAVSEELGGRFRLKGFRAFDPTQAKDYADRNYEKIGGFSGVKALVRAKWEVSQYLLEKAGISTVQVYRGIKLPKLAEWSRTSALTPAEKEKHPYAIGKLVHHPVVLEGEKPQEAKPTEYYNTPDEGDRLVREHREEVVGRIETKTVTQNWTKLPDLPIERNGAVSTSLNSSVSNGWGERDTRVVLRAEVPRTAVVSLPAYGQNYHKEREVIVAGTAWKNWDAWYGQAPEFDEVPMPKPDDFEELKKAA